MGNVLEAVEAWAEKQADKPLYVFLDAHGKEVSRLTYAGFLARVDAIASHLVADTRLAMGDRVLIAYPPGLEMICAFFACTRAGLIPVPVPALTAHGVGATLFRMQHVARDCQAAGVLTDRDGLERRMAQADCDTSLSSLAWIVTEDMHERVAADLAGRANEIFFLQYTSGSTSDPKGVMVSHDNILINAKLVVNHEMPISVSWLPQHHDMGLIGYYLNTALSGGTLYGFSPTSFIQRPSLWLETISKYKATATSAPNFAFEHCMRPGRISAASLEMLDLSSLRILMAAAEPIKPSVYRAFLQMFEAHGLKPESFVVAYGLAENTLAVSCFGRNILSLNKTALANGVVKPTTEVSEVASATHILSCGRVLGDNHVAIVDPELCSAMRDGEVGEIWISGSSKCLGYWGRPTVSAETFQAQIANDDTPERYLRTGDMGFYLDGELYVCGRRKDMLIVRGQNYYPQDIEIIVEQVDGIRKSGVAAVESSSEGDAEIVILAELANSRTIPDAMAIANAVRDRLNVEVARVVFVAPRSLPKTSSGKLMRQKSRMMWEGGEFTVMGGFARDRTSDAEASLQADGQAFGFFKSKYKLTGEETHTLIDAGLDSMDLVLFLHELSELLADKGARELADQVDTRLVQQMTIAELFRMVARLDHQPETAVAQIRLSLASVDQARRSEDDEMMARDRHLTFTPAEPVVSAETGTPREILLTGATGFLGPFLLTSLLEQTQAKIHCLVRADTPEHAAKRLRTAVAETSQRDAEFWRIYDRRVTAVCGDLDQPALGLTTECWNDLAAEIDTIYHNGALVNYLFSYRKMRQANVVGTNEILKLAFDGRPKVFNYVSTTFIFGWATKDVLWETDSNADMELLDFGYSQSKWTAEQVVMDAGRRGLTTRIFRPALVTPAVNGDGANFDITLRLLAFMVKYGVGVDALNQVSFMPADTTANNIVAISGLPQTAGGTFHVTRDDYANMIDVTTIITRMTGRQFKSFETHAFVPEVIRRCTREDLLFPLLDFLVGSVDNISSMEFKRYDSSVYQEARNASPWGRPDPSLTDTVAGMLRFMRRAGMVDLPDIVQAKADAA